MRFMENLEIVVDHREMQGIIPELLYSKKMKITLKQLIVGDYIISERVVVERKNMDDFINSIIDGRVFRQAKALSVYPIPIIVIISDESQPRMINKNAVYGAISSLIVDFGMRVLIIKNLSEFADLLYSLAKQEQVENKREIRLLGVKKCSDIAEQQQLIVECLPMVGPKLAKNLLSELGSVKKIVNASEKRLTKIEGVGKKRAEAIQKIVSAKYGCEDDKNSGKVDPK